jgi:hypothetical protein
MIFSETGIHQQNWGVPEFCHCQFAQIGNIRFAVVKPEGRLFRDHALTPQRSFHRQKNA